MNKGDIKLQIRFYEELNDFLPLEKRKTTFNYSVAPNTAVKDVIESLGVPHTERPKGFLRLQKARHFYYAESA